MERIIKLSKFRNIGLKEEERFVLNTSLEKKNRRFGYFNWS